MKYWREVLIGVLVILLGVNIYLLVLQSKRTDKLEAETKEYQAFVKESLEINTRILEETVAAKDSLTKAANDKKVIIVTKKEYYETFKKSPVRTDYTSADLSSWIKSLESEAKFRKDSASLRRGSSSGKR